MLYAGLDLSRKRLDVCGVAGVDHLLCREGVIRVQAIPRWRIAAKRIELGPPRK